MQAKKRFLNALSLRSQYVIPSCKQTQSMQTACRPLAVPENESDVARRRLQCTAVAIRNRALAQMTPMAYRTYFKKISSSLAEKENSETTNQAHRKSKCTTLQLKIIIATNPLTLPIKHPPHRSQFPQ